MMKIIFLILIVWTCTVQAESADENRINSYREFLKTIPYDSKIVQIEKVNEYFNLLSNESDETVWGIEDYWATPKELIKKGRGDCEDFAIAKYFALKSLGFDPNNMMILIVKADSLSQLHVVLGVKSDSSEIIILDNLSWKVLPLKKRKDLKIVRWVNESLLDRFDSPDTFKLSNVIQKMKNED